LVILEKRISGLSGDALARFILRARRAAGVRGQVNVLVAPNATLRSLNQRFRGKDKATDVLSFPATAVRDNRDGIFAGEIAISADIATQNAVRFGHSPALEVKILALHGILHLAGFDHERDNGQMARKEAGLRQALRLPSSLAERSQPQRGKSRTRRIRRTA